MRTVETKIYKFDELNDDAKQTAIDYFRETEDFSWLIGEATDTLNAFCEIFPVRWSNIDFTETYRSSWSVNLDDSVSELSGWRLSTYLWNNYRHGLYRGKYYGKLVNTFPDGRPIPKSKEHPIGQRHVFRHSNITMENSCILTGMCYDDSILGPIYDFMENPSDVVDFSDLLNDCMDTLISDVWNAIEAQYQDDNIIESIDAYGYEFTEDGKLFINKY